MALEILRKIGLSEGEIKVYSALLDLGISPLNKVHEKTGIERRNIYDILNKLIERGLITYSVENKKRVFQISHPNKIIGYIEEKKHNLDETEKEIIKEIPSLTEKFNFKRPLINAEIYRGNEGVESRADVLDIADERINSLQHLPRRLMDLPVQRVDRHAEAGMVFVIDDGPVRRVAKDPVFGSKQSLHVRDS